MSKGENNEQMDTDILQCKMDILRAHDITPPPENPVTQNSVGETAQSSDNEDINQIPIEEIPPALPKVATLNKEEENEIPSFDLAEEIMAEQRKIAAARRKAPGQKNEVQKLKPQVQSVDHITERPKQDEIIAEIVARDIEKLCRGDYSGG